MRAHRTVAVRIHEASMPDKASVLAQWLWLVKVLASCSLALHAVQENQFLSVERVTSNSHKATNRASTDVETDSQPLMYGAIFEAPTGAVRSNVERDEARLYWSWK